MSRHLRGHIRNTEEFKQEKQQKKTLILNEVEEIKDKLEILKRRLEHPDYQKTINDILTQLREEIEYPVEDWYS